MSSPLYKVTALSGDITTTATLPFPVPAPNEGVLFSIGEHPYQIYWQNGTSDDQYYILAQDLGENAPPYPNNQISLWNNGDTKIVEGSFILSVGADNKPTLVPQS